MNNEPSTSSSEFLVKLHHEFHTPLTIVLGLTEVLLDEVYGNLTFQQRESLQEIESNGKQLLTQIETILSVVEGK